MKFDVLNRFTGKVQFTAEIECDDNTLHSIKLGLAVKWAIKAHADLAGAYLAHADLAHADLTGADLAGADLADALKIDDKEIPVIPQIDAKILAAIEAGGALCMSSWHEDGPCGTTHCRAGWAIHLAGEAGYALEKKVGSQMAGAMIYRKSRPGQPAPWFFASDEQTLSDIRKCAAEQA